jgi:anti-anti-sigma factor
MLKMRLSFFQGDSMATTPQTTLEFEIEKSKDPHGQSITTIICHGRLVSETSAQIKEVIKPLIPEGGIIRLDLTDLNYMDSSGLGTLVGLKVSALREGYCRLELVNLSPRVADLLRLSNLSQLFSS